MIVDHSVIRWNNDWLFIMMKTDKSRHITVNWKGPFGIGDVLAKRVDGSANGIYQIYSDHPIFGRNTLLYIGKTFGKEGNRSFHSRLAEHDGEWACYESNCCAYLGEVSDSSGQAVGNSTIELAETLLIAWHYPPYCTRSKEYDSTKLQDLWVQSIGNRQRLFECVSTGWIIFDRRKRVIDYQASTRLEHREGEVQAYVARTNLKAALEATPK